MRTWKNIQELPEHFNTVSLLWSRATSFNHWPGQDLLLSESLSCGDTRNQSSSIGTARRDVLGKIADDYENNMDKWCKELLHCTGVGRGARTPGFKILLWSFTKRFFRSSEGVKWTFTTAALENPSRRPWLVWSHPSWSEDKKRV